MILAKRFAFLIFAALILLYLVISTRSTDYHATLQDLSQKVGLGELVDDEEYEIQQQTEASRQPLVVNQGALKNGSSRVFPPGAVKPAGETYTRGLVVGKLSSENTTWLESYLMTDANLRPYLYVVDDVRAPLHTSMNKGHEAMVYLTYIVDHYDDPAMPDIVVFMHPHQLAWHTPELLNHDAGEALKRLSSERVVREGYMNLRCHWDPGCPERLHPGKSWRDNLKREEVAIAAAWAELFVDDPIPDAIGAPCCAQFAVSRERIRATPKKKYQKYRDWLIRTDETDWISGRVFEYLWHKIFTDQSQLCPDARACYCDGYGICFESDGLFNDWFHNHFHWSKSVKELEKWDEQAALVAGIGDWDKIEQMNINVPLPGRNLELKEDIQTRFEKLVKLRTAALENGTDPEVRAAVARRPWMAID